MFLLDLPDAARGLDAVEDRHADVHQDSIERAFLGSEELDGLGSVRSALVGAPAAVHEALQDPANTPCNDIAVDQQCQRGECDGTGQCLAYDLPDNTPCNTTQQSECAVSECINGTCTLVPDQNQQNQPCAFQGSNPLDCAQAVCIGIECVLVPINENQPCNSLPPVPCNVAVCQNGACSYTPTQQNSPCTAVPPNSCQFSACNGQGACTFFDKQQGTPCSDVQVDPQCAFAVCNNQDQCIGLSNATGQPCSGSSSLSPSCVRYQCTQTGGCQAVPLQDGTRCNDSNLCDLDTCMSGICQHTQAVTCDQPPGPCSEPAGTCNPQTGQCVYQGLGAGVPCQPQQNEIVPGCTPSASNYVCNNSLPTSACQADCPGSHIFVAVPTSTTSGAASSNSGSTKVGAIVGGVLGGLLVAGALVAAAIWYIRRRMHQDSQSGQDSSSHNNL